MDKTKEVGVARPGEKSGHLTAIEIQSRLDEARILGEDDKLLLAGHLLHGIGEELLQPVHRDILRESAKFNTLLQESAASLDRHDGGGWVKQGEHTGRQNFSMHYKLADGELSCRLESIVLADLVVPFLSVLNESELYSTWLPDWRVPRIRVVKSEKLRQSGRCGQIVDVETEIPWPLDKRQVILKAVACDNIDRYPEVDYTTDCLGQNGGKILIRIQSIDGPTNSEEEVDVPPAKKGVVRMKVEGGFTIRKCPSNHPLVKQPRQSEGLVLLTFTFCVDPHLAVLPKSLLNFFLRTAMGRMWSMFLDVAEDVRDEKRPAHNEAIAKKREALYDWVEERTRVMLGS